MFTTITSLQACRKSTSETNPQQPMSCPKKTLLVTEVALSVIAIGAGVCVFLVATGVNLGPLNAISVVGPIGAGSMIGAGVVVLTADMITVCVVMAKRATRYTQLSEPSDDSERIRELEAQIEQLNARIETTPDESEEVQRLEGRIQALTQEIETTRSQTSASSSEQVQNLQRQIESQRARIDQLTQEKARLQEGTRDSSNLESEMRQLREEKTALENQLAQAQVQAQEGSILRTQLNQAQAQKRNLETQLERARQEASSRQKDASKTEELNTQLTQLKSEKQQLLRDLEQSRAASQRANSEQIRALETERDRLRQELEALRSAPSSSTAAPQPPAPGPSAPSAPPPAPGPSAPSAPPPAPGAPPPPPGAPPPPPGPAGIQSSGPKKLTGPTMSFAFKVVTIEADQLDCFGKEPTRPSTEPKVDLGKPRVIHDMGSEEKQALISSIETFLNGTHTTRHQKKGVETVQVKIANKDGMTHALQSIESLVTEYEQIKKELEAKELHLREAEQRKARLDTAIGILERKGSSEGKATMRLNRGKNKEAISFHVFSKQDVENMKAFFNKLSESDRRVLEKRGLVPHKVESLDQKIEQFEQERSEATKEIQTYKSAVARLTEQKKVFDEERTISGRDSHGSSKEISFKEACDLYKKKQQIAEKWSTILNNLKRSQDELMQIHEVEEVEVNEDEQKLAELLGNPALAPLRTVHDVSKQFETPQEQATYGRNFFKMAN